MASIPHLAQSLLLSPVPPRELCALHSSEWALTLHVSCISLGTGVRASPVKSCLLMSDPGNLGCPPPFCTSFFIQEMEVKLSTSLSAFGILQASVNTPSPCQALRAHP